MVVYVKPDLNVVLLPRTILDVLSPFNSRLFRTC